MQQHLMISTSHKQLMLPMHLPYSFYSAWFRTVAMHDLCARTRPHGGGQVLKLTALWPQHMLLVTDKITDKRSRKAKLRQHWSWWQQAQPTYSAGGSVDTLTMVHVWHDYCGSACPLQHHVRQTSTYHGTMPCRSLRGQGMSA